MNANEKLRFEDDTSATSPSFYRSLIGISIEKLMEVMEELGALRDDAQEMMQLLDSNSDGSVSSEEFNNFQKHVNYSCSSVKLYLAVLLSIFRLAVLMLMTNISDAEYRGQR